MIGVGGVTFLAGLLFGYDQGVISGALPLLQHLSLVDAIGESTTFFMFSALCIVTYVFVHRWVPETKGTSLEEIQDRWVVKGDLMLDEEPA